MAMQSRTVSVHSRFNRATAIGLWAASAAAVVGVATAGGTDLAWVYPAAGLASWLAWGALWRPAVEVGPAGVALRNVTHRVDVPWEALVHVDTKHALTLHTPGRRFQAWSAPAPGALSASVAGRRADNRELRSAGGAPRPGDLIGTDSGNAALIIREEWQRRIEAGEVTAGVAEQTKVVRRWTPTVPVVAVALGALTLWALVAVG